MEFYARHVQLIIAADVYGSDAADNSAQTNSDHTFRTLHQAAFSFNPKPLRARPYVAYHHGADQGNKGKY